MAGQLVSVGLQILAVYFQLFGEYMVFAIIHIDQYCYVTVYLQEFLSVIYCTCLLF